MEAEKNQKSRLAKIIIILVILIACTYIHDFLIQFSIYNRLHSNYPWYIAESLDKLLILLLCGIGLHLLYRSDIKGMLRELKLNAPAFPAVLFALVASIPMFVGFVFTRKIEPVLAVPNLIFMDLFSPIVEEIHVRGFGFWQLRSRLFWPFWIAIIPQAILSGLGHIEKGTDWLEILGIFLLIFSGGVIFSWLLEQWRSLWVPFFLHAFMNMWWDIFTVSTTVIGGWLPFVFQQLTMLSAIGITVYLKRKGKLRSN